MREYHGELLISHYFSKYDSADLESIWHIGLDIYKARQEQAVAAGSPGTRFFSPSMPPLIANCHSYDTRRSPLSSRRKCHRYGHGIPCSFNSFKRQGPGKGGVDWRQGQSPLPPSLHPAPFGRYGQGTQLLFPPGDDGPVPSRIRKWRRRKSSTILY